MLIKYSSYLLCQLSFVISAELFKSANSYEVDPAFYQVDSESYKIYPESYKINPEVLQINPEPQKINPETSKTNTESYKVYTGSYAAHSDPYKNSKQIIIKEKVTANFSVIDYVPIDNNNSKPFPNADVSSNTQNNDKFIYNNELLDYTPKHVASEKDANLDDIKNIALITVILRHGHRTPDSLYPNYPDKNETFYPHGFGELTNQGKRREYSIGRALRRRYSNLLGQIVETDTLIARSSAVLRAKRSLLLVLAGLYPPSGSQVWDPTVNWQAIPTSYLPLEQDNRFFGAWCPKMNDLLGAYKQTEEYKTTFQKYNDAFEYITQMTGMPVRDYQAVMRLFFDFKGQKDFGVPLPEWTKNVFPEPMQSMSIEMYKMLTANEEMKKNSAGYMMKKILEEMLQKVEGKAPKNRKAYIWSGHEINIAFVMRLLDIYWDHAPPFGAYLTFELHNVKGEYGVKILYQDYEGPRLKVLVIPGCEVICPFFKFASIVEKFLPEEKCDTNTLDVAHIKTE